MNAILKFRISKQNKSKFTDYCMKNNMNISEVMRAFIEKSIKEMEFETLKNELLKRQTSK